MLINVLKEIAHTQTHASSLAKTLKIDPEMVKQMLYNLQRMGYIVSDDPACGDNRCEECGVCSTKRKNKLQKENKENKQNETSPTLMRWRLTEKGKNAVEGKEK